PWLVPPADDLVRGADLKLVGDRTVAVVPHWAATAKDAKGKPVEYDRIQLVFAADGALAGRQIVRLPEGEVRYRETYSPEGVVRLLAGDGKELSVRKGTLAAAEAPALTADLSKLVVLALPYRTTAHVRETLNLGKKEHNALRFDEGLPLLAAAFAANDG